MRLSELTGVLFQLQQIAHTKGNFDPIVEFFHQDGETVELNVNIQAINADPEGQLLRTGTIHLPLIEIVKRGYVIVYGTAKGEDSIIIQASCEAEAESLFLRHFSTYKLKSVQEEV